MAKADVYQVRESFVGNLDGAEVEYHRGEIVAATDPAIRKWPAAFVPLVVRGHVPQVEQATAGPGEKRGS